MKKLKAIFLIVLCLAMANINLNYIPDEINNPGDGIWF